MRFPFFMYRAGGYVWKYRGKFYEYLSVNSQEEVDAALKKGWHLTRDEALFPAPSVATINTSDPTQDDAPPTRAELEQKAAELGIKVDGRWKDARLIAEIEKVS